MWGKEMKANRERDRPRRALNGANIPARTAEGATKEENPIYARGLGVRARLAQKTNKDKKNDLNGPRKIVHHLIKVRRSVPVCFFETWKSGRPAFY